MAQVFKVKSTQTEGREPLPEDIEVSELALNLTDQRLYSKDQNGVVFEIGNSGPKPIAPALVTATQALVR